jgi:hypothetical protein
MLEGNVSVDIAEHVPPPTELMVFLKPCGVGWTGGGESTKKRAPPPTKLRVPLNHAALSERSLIGADSGREILGR